MKFEEVAHKFEYDHQPKNNREKRMWGRESLGSWEDSDLGVKWDIGG